MIHHLDPIQHYTLTRVLYFVVGDRTGTSIVRHNKELYKRLPKNMYTMVVNTINYTLEKQTVRQ